MFLGWHLGRTYRRRKEASTSRSSNWYSCDGLGGISKSVNTVTQGTKVNGRTLTAKEMQKNVEWSRDPMSWSPNRW